MSRRGEVPFVAMRVGRSRDPREVLGFAKDLKIEPALAFAYVALWEEFILEVGDALTGRIKGYTAVHIAAKLTWPGSPLRLVNAMKKAGILGTHRGTFFHPFWCDTITGGYAAARAARREMEADRKRRQRAGQNGEVGVELENSVPPLSHGTGAAVPPLSHGIPDIKKERTCADTGSAPPQPPRETRAGVGFTRWKEIEHLVNKPTYPEACIRLLDVMTNDDWPLCRWVVDAAQQKTLPYLSRKKRAFTMNSHQFLRSSAFLWFRREYLAEMARPATVPIAVEEAQKAEEREKEKRKTLKGAIDDPSLPEAEKQRLKNLYLKANPGDSLDWLGTNHVKGNN